MKYLMLVNPASGTVVRDRLVPRLYRKMRRMRMDADIVFTEGPGHGAMLARRAAADGYDAVLACGGDGTVNEIAGALAGSGTPLGIIPAGSGNGLARHLGIPADAGLALKVVAENNIISCDYGLANNRPFFCTFGVGFDAAVSERCAREQSRGFLMYLRNTIGEYFRFSPEEYTIEVNGHTITERAFLVVACNASQYGNNAFIAPQASVTDGMLDITIVHGGNILSEALAGVDILTGMVRKNAYMNVIRTTNARIIRHRRSAAHLDGDAVTMPETIDVKVVKGALRVFAPVREMKFIPILTPTALFFRDLGLLLRRFLPGGMQ